VALNLLTNVSITNVYREGNYRSETISQSHLGEKLEVLEEQEDWLRVRLSDGYEGWVPRGAVSRKPRGWDDAELFFPASQVSWIYQSPDTQATTLRDITMLSGLPLLDRQEGWVQVELPDGQVGWMQDRQRFPVQTPEVEALIQTAFQFLGIQYAWGGRSPKGFDCSGFTQTVFGLNGFQLPRDAWQQAEIGIRKPDDHADWGVGDLIFFSERPDRMTHVALSLGKGDFIHASGFVKLNSLNPDNHELFVGHYAGMFTKTMQVLP